MKIKLFLFVIGCAILQHCSGASVEKASASGVSAKETGIDPATYINLGGKYYYFSPDNVEVSPLEATRFCNSDGMKLISFDEEEKSQLIYDYLTDNGITDRFWTSGEKWQGAWRWASTGQLFTYTNWAVGEPNLVSTSACVYYNAGTRFWHDEDCLAIQSHFICEY